MVWNRRQFITIGTGAVAGSVFIGACSDDDDAPDAAGEIPSTTTTSAPTDLPANDEQALKALFDPFLEPIGQKVTRVGLYDLSVGFELSDTGDHVAIYAEPIDPEGEGWDTARYIEATAPGMAATAPFVFDTWAGVNSMDLCQEPPQAEAPEPEPPIVTQINLSRADSAFIDWENVTLADLIAARLRSPQTARASAGTEVRQHPDWIAAEEAAADLV